MTGDTLPFVKMQALGNDYVVVEAQHFARHDVDLAALAQRVCARWTGVGADGLIVLGGPTDRAHATMRIINADGSDGGRCGNGLRCVARLLCEQGKGERVSAQQVTLRIDVGDCALDAHVTLGDAFAFVSATVDMDAPDFSLETARADEASLRCDGPLRSEPAAMREEHVWMWRFPNAPGEVAMVCIGNPHVIAFMQPDAKPGSDTALDERFACIARSLAQHRAFARGINAHVARVDSEQTLTLRSWERGVGETRACGTGACAAVAAGLALGLLSGQVTVRMKGGSLLIERLSTGPGVMRMTGGAKFVFAGEVPLA